VLSDRCYGGRPASCTLSHPRSSPRGDNRTRGTPTRAGPSVRAAQPWTRICSRSRTEAPFPLLRRFAGLLCPRPRPLRALFSSSDLARALFFLPSSSVFELASWSDRSCRLVSDRAHYVRGFLPATPLSPLAPLAVAAAASLSAAAARFLVQAVGPTAARGCRLLGECPRFFPRRPDAAVHPAATARPAAGGGCSGGCRPRLPAAAGGGCSGGCRPRLPAPAGGCDGTSGAAHRL